MKRVDWYAFDAATIIFDLGSSKAMAFLCASDAMEDGKIEKFRSTKTLQSIDLQGLKTGSGGRVRTYDLVVNSHPLYR